MAKILVSGLINMETAVQVDHFPLVYEPVRYLFFGIHSSVSGVGFNVALALHTLGSEVRLLSLVGSDAAGGLARQALRDAGIGAGFVAQTLAETAQSVILVDRQGARQIHTDLKDVQERPYPPDLFHQALPDCALALLCNVNWNRPFLSQARAAGKRVATDVHAIADLEDEYNRDFMAAADILFMSHEKLPAAPEAWARRVQARYGTPILVIGLGAAGALLAVKDDNFIERIPAAVVRPVVNTVGAGDALFAAFNHVYRQTQSPYEAIQKAILFAGYKIGESGGAAGFLMAAELDALAARQR